MENAFEKGKIFRFPESIAYSAGSVVSKTLIKKPSGTVTLFAFDKGEALSEHTAPFDALIQLLEGKVEVIIGGVSNHLSVGDSIVMPANIPHAVTATDRCKWLLTMIKDLQ